MSEWSAWSRALTAILLRDARIQFSYRLRSLGQLLAVFLTLSLFFYSSKLVGPREFKRPEEYFAFVVVGLAITEVLTATLTAVPLTLRSELMTGTFERMAVSPLGVLGAVAGMMLFPIALALTIATALVVFAAIGFGLSLQFPGAILALPVAVLGALAFAPFALAFAAAVLLIKQSGSGATFVVTGLSLLSGAFFPRSLLPGYIRWTGDIQPLTPALELLRHLLVGSTTGSAPGWDLLRLVGFAAVGLPLGLIAVSVSADLCRQRATLVEY